MARALLHVIEMIGCGRLVATTRKYTFIRRQTNSAKDARYVSTDAFIAARFAANGHAGVAFEALNDFEDPVFVIRVNFSDDALSRIFDRRIRVACDGLGLIARDISAPVAKPAHVEAFVGSVPQRFPASNVSPFDEPAPGARRTGSA
jgi:hypothetical protein